MAMSEIDIFKFHYHQMPAKHLVYKEIVHFDDVEPNIIIVGKTATKKFHYIGTVNYTPYHSLASMVYYNGEFYVYFGITETWAKSMGEDAEIQWAG